MAGRSALTGRRPLRASAAARARQAMPALADGGEDAAPDAPLAEEFDLSDVLAEEVSAAPGSKEELLRRADAELQARLPRLCGACSPGSRLSPVQLACASRSIVTHQCQITFSRPTNIMSDTWMVKST